MTGLQKVCALTSVDKSSHQAPRMPPDSAFLHSRDLSLRSSSRPLGQYDLPRFPSRGTSYAFDSGLAYPADMPAPCVLPRTMDPSTLLRGQIPTPTVPAASVNDSDVEMDYEGGSNGGGERQLDDDVVNDWEKHPDTIRVGNPDFSPTKTFENVRDAAGAHVLPKIHGRFVLKRKTPRQQKYWILYRRNYFGIQASYSLDSPLNPSPDERLYLHRDNLKPEPIKALFMCMRGVVETEHGPEISIVVFDAKRKPQHEGDEPPPIEPQRMKPSKERATKFYAKSTGDRLDNIKAPMNHTFPRNQFKSATQNNGARRSEQQTYHILLELKAEIVVNGLPQLVTVASQMSDPLVVRGRCPLSFKFKDKERQAVHSTRRGKKEREARDKGRTVNKGASTKTRPEPGKQEASRGSCHTISNQRSTRVSSHVPSLIYEAESRNTATAPMSPLSTSYTTGGVDRQTIRSLDRKLVEYQDAIGEVEDTIIT